jgi:hypothetical protein
MLASTTGAIERSAPGFTTNAHPAKGTTTTSERPPSDVMVDLQYRSAGQ